MPASVEELVDAARPRGDRGQPVPRPPARHLAAAGLRRPGRGAGAGGGEPHRARRATHVHSLHSYFLRPGDTRCRSCTTSTALRDGRSFATRGCRPPARPADLRHDANFQMPEEGLEHQDPMPDVPAARGLPEPGRGRPAGPAATPSEWEREWAALDVRYAGDSAPGRRRSTTACHPAQVAAVDPGQRRPCPTTRSLHTAAFTYASDMTLLGATLVPHGCYIGSPGMQAASLDHTIWFHRPFRADEWWLYDQVSPSASGGRGLAIARVFTQDGRLVAASPRRA